MYRYRTFESWMVQVDKLLVDRLGVCSADLPDCCYADWYEDGLTPGQAARMARQQAD